MKVTVKSNYLNVRVGAPSLNAPSNRYLEPGEKLEVDGKLYRGDSYQGNNVWMKDESNNYYWSGGLLEVNVDKFAVQSNKDTPSVTMASGISYDNVVELINDQGSRLKKKFPNIKRLYPAFQIADNCKTPCVDICTVDDDTEKIPKFLNLTLPDDTIIEIQTRFITNFKNAKPLTGKGGFIGNTNTRGYLGTVCCSLSSAVNTDQQYLLTCNHVMTGGKLLNPGSIGDHAVALSLGQYQDIGIWEDGIMSKSMDAAIINVSPIIPIDPNNINSGIYSPTENDSGVTMVSFNGSLTTAQLAYIIHVNQKIDVDYDDGNTVEIGGMITLSTDPNPSNYSPGSQKGDSGALIFNSSTLQPIAMLIGANEQFTYALPIDAVLKSFPKLQLSINS